MEIRNALTDYVPNEPVEIGKGDHDERSFLNALTTLTLTIEWLLLMQSIRKVPTDLPGDEGRDTIPFSGR
jgi:hypothetical protein